MITEIILLIFRGIISLMVVVLPSPSSLPDGLQDVLSNFSGYFAKANFVFPVDTLFQCLSFLVVFETGILLFKFFNFALNKLRGSG